MQALGDDPLDRWWLCVRTYVGVGFIPIDDFVWQSLIAPPADLQRMTDLLRPYRVPGPQLPPELPAAGRLLGCGMMPARLSTRAGTLLSDHLLLMTPTANQLRDVDAPAMQLDADWVLHMKRVLYSQLHRKEFILSGLRWPLTPTPTIHSITAEMLVSWQLDFATDFARLIGTETYLCDLRMTTVAVLPMLADLEGLSAAEALVRILLAVHQREPSANKAREALKDAQRLYGTDLDARPELLGPSGPQLRRAWTEVRKRSAAQMREQRRAN